MGHPYRPVVNDPRNDLMQDEASTNTIERAKRRSVGVAGLVAAIAIAGAVFAFTSVQAEASPNKVTASKPCGSCHPPNKPPKPKR
jgi:hypothetical protein